MRQHPLAHAKTGLAVNWMKPPLPIYAECATAPASIYAARKANITRSSWTGRHSYAQSGFVPIQPAPEIRSPIWIFTKWKLLRHGRRFNEMNSAAAITFDAGSCSLCGQPNDCQLCTVAAYKGPCWCAQVKIPDELIAQVPAGLGNKACTCRSCVMKFHRAEANNVASPKILPGDFYFDGGLMVFSAKHHLRRGYCCGKQLPPLSLCGAKLNSNLG